MALSDRIVVMNTGRAEQIDRPHDAYERPATPFVASFLGKTNVLAGRMRRDGDVSYAVIGDGRWPAPAATGGDAVLVSVRPERIGFADGAACSLGGTVRTRIFQGNHWLYQIETPSGLVTLIRQNSGEPAPVEGAAVRLTWRAEDMAIRPAEGGAS
jgi:putative spermidine/putrescine transport system ATP-binding protein